MHAANSFYWALPVGNRFGEFRFGHSRQDQGHPDRAVGLHPQFHASGATAEYPRLREVVDELRRKPEFDDLWRRPRVNEKTSGKKEMLLPEVGELDVQYDTFGVRGAAGQQPVVYSAPAGCPTFERLMLLGTLHADDLHG